MFKRSKLKPRKHNKIRYRRSILSKVLWLLWVLFVLLFWINVLENLKETKVNNSGIPANLEEKKEENISVLITWRWGKSNDAPSLTDTLIVASFDSEKNSVSMLSIPRDLYIEYPSWGEWKINELFLREIKNWSTREEWFIALTEKIEEITGEEIKYFVDIDFDGFIAWIDLIWWVTIDVKEKIVDTQYPDWNWWYETFVIWKWKQTIDWKTALKYVRSRYSTSDFDRSLRQQQVIQWVKDKLTSLWYLSNPAKIKELYSTYDKYFTTNLTLWTIIKLALKGRKVTKDDVYSFNLNTSCANWNCEKWWILYNPIKSLFNDLYVLLPYWASNLVIDEYSQIQKFARMVFHYPEVTQSDINIKILNATKIPWLALKIANNLKKYGFNIPSKNSIWNMSLEDNSRSVVFYSWIEEDDKVLEALSFFIFSNKIKITPENYMLYFEEDDLMYLNKEIRIALWKDYTHISK